MGLFTSTKEERDKKRAEREAAFNTGVMIGLQKTAAAREAREKKEEERKKNRVEPL